MLRLKAETAFRLHLYSEVKAISVRLGGKYKHIEKLIDLKMATMTCEEIFSLHASDTENQICTMPTGMYRLTVGMKCIRTTLLCIRLAILQTLPLWVSCWKEVRIRMRETMTVIHRCVSWRSGTPVRMIPCMPIFPDYCFTKGRR